MKTPSKVEIIIMQGVSGSGKSTYIKHNFPSATVVSADHFFINAVTGIYEFKGEFLADAHGQCLIKFIEAVIAQNNDTVNEGVIVVDNTNCTIAEIAPYAAIALAYGHKLQIICLDIEPKTAASRNLHGVEESVVVMMNEKIKNSAKEFPPYWPRKVISLYGLSDDQIIV